MIMAAALLTLSLFASCNKNSNGTNGTVTSFTAGIEQNAPSTRTYLSNWDIFWSENDAIKVVNNSGQQATFTLDAEGAGTQTASFTTEDTFNDDPDFIGAYPTTAIINNGEVSFNLPQTQTITETGTFANVSMPMVSHSDNTNLLFKNVLGGICFPLKGSFQVSKIVLTAVDTDDMLWGQMTTGWSDDAPTVASLTDGSNAITLECATPVQLNTTTAEEFYIMVPPTMLEKGFTIQVYEGTAVKYEQTVDWTSAPQTGFIPRNLVRVANELNIDMFNIVATCSPEVGGTVSGAGAYRSGDNCTLSVTPATNYNFLGWKKDGATDYYSTEPSISFTVTENASFVAYFDAPLTVTVIADASNGGTVTGGGTYHVGDECTITATPNSGWRFMGWKETGSETILSTETSYTFTVTGDASYTALFSSLTVTTTSPTYIDIHSATSGGTIQTQGSTTITERGVCYATNNNPTLDGDYAVSTATSNTYTAEMSGMTKDVVYWVRAYVKEANGAVTYGEAIPFATRKDYANDYNGRLPFGYSISASRTVNFSMGNLYYMGADGGYWKFADYQFEYLNTDQANENANINRDKFAFATSNQAHGSLSPQPWSSGNGGNNRYYMNHFYAYHDLEPHLERKPWHGRLGLQRHPKRRQHRKLRLVHHERPRGILQHRRRVELPAQLEVGQPLRHGTAEREKQPNREGNAHLPRRVHLPDAVLCLQFDLQQRRRLHQHPERGPVEHPREVRRGLPACRWFAPDHGYMGLYGGGLVQQPLGDLPDAERSLCRRSSRND